jgi:hypothetical protein
LLELILGLFASIVEIRPQSPFLLSHHAALLRKNAVREEKRALVNYL